LQYYIHTTRGERGNKKELGVVMEQEEEEWLGVCIESIERMLGNGNTEKWLRKGG